MSTQAEPETISELTKDGITANVQQNAPSLAGREPSPAELDASQLTYSLTTAPREVPEPNSADVWKMNVATDHMITVKWRLKTGWDAPQLVPYGPLSIMPTASALHYATECFEGMKLYRGHDGAVRLFRPDKNAARMLNSAVRVALPAFRPEALTALISALVAIDAPKWLPKDRPGSFLYVRPTLIADHPTLAVRKPEEALLFIILVNFPPFDEPGGSLGPPGVRHAATAANTAKPRKPGVRLLASEDDMVRAWPGGFGNSKLGANYGPSLVASAAASARGYDQILWLFGEQGWVTEAGASNFFAVIKDKASGRTQLITAPLEDQIILPGVTRISVIELVRETMPEIEVVERRYTIHELVEAADEGRLVECFAAGTAFFISAIGEIHYKGRDIDCPLSEGNFGAIGAKVRTDLRAIMYGKVDHPWGYKIKETGY